MAKNNEEVYINATGFQMLEHLQNNSVDLSLSTCGIQNCAPGHWYGPGKREEYLIHFISEGKGIYRVNGETYHLGKGDFFVIYPGTEVFYEADRDEPWDYLWVGFRGIKADTYLTYAGLDRTHLIGHYINADFILSCIQEMMLARSLSTYNELKRTSALLRILAALIEEYCMEHPEQAEDDYTHRRYLEQSLAYVKEHLKETIKVNDIAAYVGIDRSYLTNIFKRTLSLSPQEYIMHYRMNAACMLLKNTDLKVSAIASEVGYEDSLAFSKMFRKCKGVSPSEYRTQK
jgi:AraC family transcriptional regulator of arabinose operon